MSRSLGDCTLKSMHEPPIVITDPETYEVRNECNVSSYAGSACWGVALRDDPSGLRAGRSISFPL